MSLLGRQKLLSYSSLLRRCVVPLAARTNHVRQLATEKEPEYLNYLGPPQPVYDALNIRSRSYDFAVLERFGRHIHKTANNFGLNVTETWATPPRVYQVDVLKPRSKIIDQTYKLSHYERNVQVSDFPCYLMPVFVEFVSSSLPEGVELSIHPHLEEHEEIRYIPDTELNVLKEQLNDLHGSFKKK